MRECYFELSLCSAVITGCGVGVSPGFVDLPQAAGDFCCHVAEWESVFEPSDMSTGERADCSPELPDLIQLCRFMDSELRREEHKLSCFKTEREREEDRPSVIIQGKIQIHEIMTHSHKKQFYTINCNS